MFEEQLEKKGEVLREGEVLLLEDEEGRARRWKVAMTEPVLQGVAQKGVTRFLVLPSPTSVEELTNGAAPEEEDTQDDAASDDASDEFDIDESFLANSVLTPPRLSLPSSPAFPPPTNVLALTNGYMNHSTPTPRAPHGTLITPFELQQPVPAELLVPRPKEEEDDAPRVYLRTADLGRLGVFSGDWVVAEREEEGKEQQRRLVRVFASEGVVEEAAGASDGYVLSSCLSRSR